MPPLRASITVAQRVMTIVNTLGAAALGYGYSFEANQLLTAPAYQSVDRILPLQVQGIGFIGIALLLAGGLVAERRAVHVAGLAWLTLWLAGLAVMLVAGWTHGDVTFLAWVLPAWVAAACWASMLTLLAEET